MFKKPNTKKIADNGTKIGAGVVGAAVSDGLVGLVPKEYEKYKKWGKPAFALAMAIAAAAVDTKSTGGKITQGALAGMSIKQGLDALRELVLSKVDKQEGETAMARFTNHVTGLAAGTVEVPEVTVDSSMFQRNRGQQHQIPAAKQDMLAMAQKETNNMLA
ncbi:hypothetical protein [Mangrovimonas cancribranchiae]|uniref:Uncharacterized protein n=1 Tax=Mangrovimonas cancribranchiae TaxID=3080055 RepID=A0AAU6P518_9FLAO